MLLNLQSEKQFGYSRDELLGEQVTIIIPAGFPGRLLVNGVRAPADALAHQFGAGLELMALRKDGSEFPIELMMSPLNSPEGLLVTAAVRDISVRRNAERHFSQMEGKYRGLLEAAPDPMVVVNQSGEIVLLNLEAERRFGYGRHELLGQKVESIIPPGVSRGAWPHLDCVQPTALRAQRIGSGIEAFVARRRDGASFDRTLR
ncbi:MAG: PAS domain-containing protein [Hyphomonadaceae bacterium]|nr:PAS domain-containing protein [Hyphomonadaceae bacterium]